MWPSNQPGTVRGIVGVPILGADLAVLVLDDVLDLVRLGRLPARNCCFVLGAVAGTERAIGALALVLPLPVLVERADIAALFTAALLERR